MFFLCSKILWSSDLSHIPSSLSLKQEIRHWCSTGNYRKAKFTQEKWKKGSRSWVLPPLATWPWKTDPVFRNPSGEGWTSVPKRNPARATGATQRTEQRALLKVVTRSEKLFPEHGLVLKNNSCKQKVLYTPV